MTNNTLINLENGNIKLDDNILISHHLTFDSIQKFVSDNHIRDIGNGYKWVYFNHVKIQNMYYYFSICFYNNTLFHLDFNVFKYKLIKKRSWKDWSEQADLQHKQFLDNWLITLIGSTKKEFNWGRISSYYDQRSLTMGIYLKYN